MVSLDSPSMQNLVDKLRLGILTLWPSRSLTLSLNPIIPVEQFYKDACLPRHSVEKEHRHQVIGSNLMLRRQLADSMPGLLQTLVKAPLDEVLLVCPGPVYDCGRDEGLQMHHELEIWRLVSHDLELGCLDELLGVLERVLPQGLRFRLRTCQRDYLVYSRRIEVYGRKGWVKIGHCGLVNPMLLIEQGFDSAQANGLVLNLDLDRCAAVEKEWAEVWAWRWQGEQTC